MKTMTYSEQLTLQRHCAQCGQVIREARSKRGTITAAADVYALCEDLQGLRQEELHVFVLDNRNHIVQRERVYKGNISTAVVRPAEVFRSAIVHGGAGIIVVHNHPSGDPTPSADDARVTQDFVRAGHMLDITLLDHLVIGDSQQGFVSLRERKIGF
jgi:DNA repair protein RadC